MANANKTDQNKSTKDDQIVRLNNANDGLAKDLAEARDDLKKARADASRYKTNAENAKKKANKEIASAKTATQDALSEFGPSVLVVLNKESNTGDATVLEPGTVIGVMHIHDKINADYLVSAIQTGRAKVAPGITDGVFTMGDLVELKNRCGELEAWYTESMEEAKDKRHQRKHQRTKGRG